MQSALTPNVDEPRRGTPWVYLLPILSSYGLLVAIGVFSNSLIPADRVASHFNIRDQADAWVVRDVAAQQFMSLAVVLFFVNALVIAISLFGPKNKRQPLGPPWKKFPSHSLFYTGILLCMIDLLIAAIQLSVLWYNTRGALLFSFASLPVLALPLLILVVAIYLILATQQEPAS